ncbi:hypothetical protein [Bdellovibrio sp. KM01]|uniref:hypothetical protein n=1 Tax=Bdellovibrio sp. KM01 TaxID=2748865 RepID=UPI0015EABB6D|nr:hypothetical protein [Bdellovibrio sp. KM01]QLY24413.1 hypothetical protein HW988_13215 [Bdellovibrio sp. KM01]
MRKLISIMAFMTFAGVTAQASFINVHGTWGTDSVNWEIRSDEKQQTWNLTTGSAQKVLAIQTEANSVQITSADGKSALAISYAPTTMLFKGQLDGRVVDLKVDHTNNGTHWFAGVFKNHRPSLRIDVPQNEKEGRATGFYKNELADLYIIPTKMGYYLKGYMNGYWIDLDIKKNEDKTYSFEGAYLNKKMSLSVTADTAIDDVIEYLLLDMPLPGIDFLNLKKDGF